MNAMLRRNWHDLLRPWNVAPALADQSLEDVCAHYTESRRFYHTLHHVQSVLETVEKLASYTQNLNAVKGAAWLHDVIYDSKASDNEERSAAYAVRLYETLSIPLGPLVADLIRKTKTHDAENDPDAQVLLDADLAILGSEESVYRFYAEQIRREYAWVPEAEYREGRRRVLQHFLNRPRIFHFLCDLETPARRNLAAEIAQWDKA